MRAFVERVHKWWTEVIAKLKARSWKAWAVVIVVAFLLTNVATSIATEGTTSLLSYVGKGLVWVAGRPMGFAGLGLLVYVLLLLGFAYYDSRPKPEPSAPVPPLAPPLPALTVEQKLELDQARKVWSKKGNPAYGYALVLSNEAIQDISPRNLAISLLNKNLVPQTMHDRESLDFMLGEHGTKPLSFAIDAIEKAHRNYMQLCCWLNWAADRASKGGLPSLEKWRGSHAKYLESLEELSACSGYGDLSGVVNSQHIIDRFPDSVLNQSGEATS